MRAKLLEDDRSLDHPEAGAARLGKQQAEDPEPGQLAPRSPVDRLAVSLCDPLRGEASRAKTTNGVLQLELFLVETEIHARRPYPRSLENI
jgi:hypothetical protein